MFRETVLLQQGFRLEVVFVAKGEWNLSLKKGKRLLVEYTSSGDYEFKSVEKLRYDFEQDVERALRQG